MQRWIIIALVIAFMLGSAQPAHAIVIADTNITFGPPPLPEVPGATHRARVIQAPNGDYTDTWFWFAPSVSLLGVINHNIDESSDWYLTPYGVPFTTASIASGQFAPLVVGDTFYPAVPIPAGDFYLGVNTGTGFGEHRRDVFGWVKLHNDGATLTAPENAMAYGEQGIYIGTTTAVPEPATAAAVGLAIAACLSRWPGCAEGAREKPARRCGQSASSLPSLAGKRMMSPISLPLAGKRMMSPFSLLDSFGILRQS